MASTSSSSTDPGASVRARQTLWPQEWPSVEYMLNWASQTYRGQPTHVFEPITEQDRKCISNMIPQLTFVANPSAFMVFAKTGETRDVEKFPFTRFHCTNMWAAQSILAAKEPFCNKLLVGFASTKGLVGIYVSEKPWIQKLTWFMRTSHRSNA